MRFCVGFFYAYCIYYNNKEEVPMLENNTGTSSFHLLF